MHPQNLRRLQGPPTPAAWALQATPALLAPSCDPSTRPSVSRPTRQPPCGSGASQRELQRFPQAPGKLQGACRYTGGRDRLSQFLRRGRLWSRTGVNPTWTFSEFPQVEPEPSRTQSVLVVRRQAAPHVPSLSVSVPSSPTRQPPFCPRSTRNRSLLPGRQLHVVGVVRCALSKEVLRFIHVVAGDTGLSLSLAERCSVWWEPASVRAVSWWPAPRRLPVWGLTGVSDPSALAQVLCASARFRLSWVCPWVWSLWAL